MIEIKNLRKSYGENEVLKGISFQVPNGAVTGFVGPNGAGKSTTMKIIAGLERANSGEALVDSQNFEKAKNPGGSLGIHFSGERFPDSMRAIDIMDYAARLVDTPASEATRLLDLVGLSDVGERAAGAFSMGMRQRLGIAISLLGDPHNVMLDEPINGLDPNGVAWVRDLLRKLARQGKAVLLSSHIMSELELVADYIVMLDHGEVIAQGTARDLHTVSEHILDISSREAENVMLLFQQLGYRVQRLSATDLNVRGIEPELAAKKIYEAGLSLFRLDMHTGTLEDTFLELSKGDK